MRYFDTSFLVPFFVEEPTSSRVEDFLKRQSTGEATISQWTRVEFASTVARQVRIGAMNPEAAREVETAFDSLIEESFVTILPTSTDFDLAKQFLRRYETALRSGDALHLAIASNHGAQAIYSLDRGLLKAGKLLGLPLKSGIRLP
jgi:predicted nucleic acid-binding protein